jgi:hypothetical protein
MSVEVEFSTPRDATPAKGTAGLRTQMGGACTTVSALRDAGKATGNDKLVKKSIG